MTELKCFPQNSLEGLAGQEVENSGLDEIKHDPEGDLLEKWLRLAEAALKNNAEKDTHFTD